MTPATSEGTILGAFMLNLGERTTASQTHILAFKKADTSHSEHFACEVIREWEQPWNVGTRIRELLGKWVEQTAILSSPQAILRSPYFQQTREYDISQLKPILVELLSKYPYHGILALGELFGPLPFFEDLAGDLDSLVIAWKEWASETGFEGDPTGIVSEFEDNEMG